MYFLTPDFPFGSLKLLLNLTFFHVHRPFLLFHHPNPCTGHTYIFLCMSDFFENYILYTILGLATVNTDSLPHLLHLFLLLLICLVNCLGYISEVYLPHSVRSDVTLQRAQLWLCTSSPWNDSGCTNGSLTDLSVKLSVPI